MAEHRLPRPTGERQLNLGVCYLAIS